MATDLRALAQRFFDAVEAGDLETVRAIYAPAARIWHNTDEGEQSVEENLATLAGFVRRIRDRRYADRRVAVFDGGFLQQHVLHGTRADGIRLRLPACIICRVENGRIVRLDEYFDSAHVAAFRATVQGGAS
jgi:ketosteroid isomerase-like protein